MNRFWLAVTLVVLVIVIAVLSLPFVAARLLRDTIDPRAPQMPAAVGETAEKLLARYEQILQKQAPKVLAATQPGLSNAEMDALEKKFHCVLPADLRALYRWRNGTARSNDL